MNPLVDEVEYVLTSRPKEVSCAYMRGIVEKIHVEVGELMYFDKRKAEA